MSERDRWIGLAWGVAVGMLVPLYLALVWWVQ